jgi:hypothetical protein
MKKSSIIFAFVISLLLDGCTTYRYIPPTSLQGQKCVQNCLSSQQNCQKDAQIKADQLYRECKTESDKEYSACKAKSDTEYIACLKYSKGTDKEKCKTSAQCIKKSCYNRPQTSSCNSYYDICFQSCGGRKEEIK